MFRLRSTSALYNRRMHADIGVFSTSSTQDVGFLGFKVPYNNTPGVGYKMVKNSNGYDGIGTINPSALLTVKGKILAGEVQIENVSSIPDYVFESDYNLRTIDKVAAYIKENKHLPEVPASTELEENGYNIGDMNNILLKKVEELTLNVIDLKKNLDLKDTQIEVLQNKVEQLEKTE